MLYVFRGKGRVGLGSSYLKEDGTHIVEYRTCSLSKQLPSIFVCLFEWFSMWNLALKLQLQYEHENGLSSVCVLKWFRKRAGLVKSLSQPSKSHLNISPFLPWFLISWSLRLDFDLKTFSQFEHCNAVKIFEMDSNLMSGSVWYLGFGAESIIKFHYHLKQLGVSKI